MSIRSVTPKSLSEGQKTTNSGANRQVYDWSHYQKAIFDFHDNGTGDVFISAAAGSSKTTTLIECAHRLPEYMKNKALFVAYNKHIADELGQRLPSGVRSQTIHSLGLGMINRWLRDTHSIEKATIEKNKYTYLCKNAMKANGFDKNHEKYKHIYDLTKTLTHYCQVTLTDYNNQNAVIKLAHDFNIEAPEQDLAIASRLVKIVLYWGIHGMPEDDENPHAKLYSPKECISYNDMIWLPHQISMPSYTYERIYVDESQDLSAAQRELILKLRRNNGRIFFVGDKRQAIYSFAGADARSVESIIEKTKCKILPLSISYRCAQKHVLLAKTLVNEIEAWDKAPEGILESINMANFLNQVKNGEFVLCRMTAPLVELALALIARRKKAYVKGRDIGDGLITLIDTVADSDFCTSSDEFIDTLNMITTEMAQNMLKNDEFEGQMQAEVLFDKRDAITVMFNQTIGDNRIESLKHMIENMFAEDSDGICLSTIHKAKGCEADTVYILKNDIMPLKRAYGNPIQLSQEYNLMYVAYTRSKNALYFIDQPVPEH